MIDAGSPRPRRCLVPAAQTIDLLAQIRHDPARPGHRHQRDIESDDPVEPGHDVSFGRVIYSGGWY